jgi:hypothetical protein
MDPCLLQLGKVELVHKICRFVKLSVLPERLAICRLDATAAIPEWSLQDFYALTRTSDELSIVCPQAVVPPGIPQEKDWRGLKVEGPLDFALTGILAAIAVPLAQTNISIFAISTYDTDYLLVRQADFDQAVHTLIQAGHQITL